MNVHVKSEYWNDEKQNKSIYTISRSDCDSQAILRCQSHPPFFLAQFLVGGNLGNSRARIDKP